MKKSLEKSKINKVKNSKKIFPKKMKKKK